MITQLPGAVFSLDIGPLKSRKETKSDKYILKSDITSVPKVAFVSGKRLYQIDFI